MARYSHLVVKESNNFTSLVNDPSILEGIRETNDGDIIAFQVPAGKVSHYPGK